MPEISRFLGIIIYMYFNDHNPPHFHVKYNDYRAIITIEPLVIQDGALPPRIFGLVMEWAELHQKDLLETWQTLIDTGTFVPIPPLV